MTQTKSPEKQPNAFLIILRLSIGPANRYEITKDLRKTPSNIYWHVENLCDYKTTMSDKLIYSYSPILIKREDKYELHFANLLLNLIEYVREKGLSLKKDYRVVQDASDINPSKLSSNLILASIVKKSLNDLYDIYNKTPVAFKSMSLIKFYNCVIESFGTASEMQLESINNSVAHRENTDKIQAYLNFLKGPESKEAKELIDFAHLCSHLHVDINLKNSFLLMREYKKAIKFE